MARILINGQLPPQRHLHVHGAGEGLLIAAFSFGVFQVVVDLVMLWKLFVG